MDEVFQFIDPIMIDGCNKHEVDKLRPSVIAASDLVVASELYSRHHCVEFVLSHMPTWPNLLMSRLQVLSQLVEVLRINDYQGFSTLSKDDEAFPYFAQCVIPELAEFCLNTLLDMGRLMEFNGVFITSQGRHKLMVTDPNWLTNKVVGEVLHIISKKSVDGVRDKSALIYSHGDLRRMVPDIPCEVSVALVLETLGLAIPVTVTKSGEILHAAADEDNNVMFLMGLVDIPMPSEAMSVCQRCSHVLMRPVFDVLESIPHCSLKLVRSVSRLFAMQNRRCCFLPGFFMKLFSFTHYQSCCPLRCWYWEDGMLLKSMVRWKVHNVRNHPIHRYSHID